MLRVPINLKSKAVTEATFDVGGFASREEAEADGNLCAVEELAEEGNHAVHEVDFDEGTADVDFAGMIADGEPLLWDFGEKDHNHGPTWAGALF